MSNELSQEQIELKQEFLDDESPLGGFSQRLDENLTKRGVPAQFGFAALLPILLELFMSVLGDCFGDDSDEGLAKKLVKPAPIHKMGLRRKVRIEMFDRSGRKFRKGNGKEMVDALLATGKESEEEEALQVVKYVRNNDIPNQDSPKWVY